VFLSSLFSPRNLNIQHQTVSVASSNNTMVNRIATHMMNAHSSSPSKVTDNSQTVPNSSERTPMSEIQHPHSPGAVSVASASEDSSKLASDHSHEKAPRRSAVVVSPDQSSDIEQLPIDELALMTTLLHKSEHKLAKEMGDFIEEPLLKENMHRFVLFPIQDNDVSTSKFIFH
jgi:hypothetical protein